MSKLLDTIYSRLGIARPVNVANQSKVKVMTIHGAKGLSAKVVFIPGLEENMLPGVKRIPYNGLVLEAARMLYVSITRAKSACVVSYANYRLINGANTKQTPSRFLRNLNGQFAQRADGFDDLEADLIIASCNNL
jgi:superfamily I DNA/RNA helicase